MPTSSSMISTTGPRRRASRSRLSFLVTVVFNYYYYYLGSAPVQCLPLPRTCTVAFIGSGRVLPLLPSSSILPPQPPRQSQSISPTTSTTLYVFFDRFIHPYGVNNDQSFENNNDEDAGMVELIDALLPRLRTKEDKSRILEGFQRARLDEQLRLSKLSRGARRDADDDVVRDHEDHQEVTRMADLFQQARLAEQLRLSMNRRRSSVRCNHDGTGGNFFDKDEAIHRALLEERLRIRRLQQRQIACSSNAIEKAMAEYELESEKERKTLQLTMVQEHESDENESGDGDESDTKQHNVDSSASFVLGASSAMDNGGHNKHIIVSKLSVNETGDAPFEQQLNDKLDHLHKMVAIATSSSPTSSNVNWKNASSTVQNILLSTYLPLPPREDATFISLIVAPMAHLLSAMFLMGSAVFYAVIAILDVLYNDDKDECSTLACLRTTSHVIRSCWDYLFLEEASIAPKWRAAAKRTMRALQTSLLASFYAVQCILMRAITHSKCATACMDAGTGSLRYLVYVIRSAHVLSIRVVNAIQKLYKSQSRIEPSQRWAPLQILSNIRLPFSRSSPSRNQRSSKDEQQRLRRTEMYNNKLRLLNLDRVNLERDRHKLLEAQRQLEFEKRKLLAEGVNVLSWYLAARNAEAAAASITGEKETTENRRVRKRHWNNIWRRNNIN